MNISIVVNIFFIGILVAGNHFASIRTTMNQDLAKQYAQILYFVNDEQFYFVNVTSPKQISIEEKNTNKKE